MVFNNAKDRARASHELVRTGRVFGTCTEAIVAGCARGLSSRSLLPCRTSRSLLPCNRSLFPCKRTQLSLDALAGSRGARFLRIAGYCRFCRYLYCVLKSSGAIAMALLSLLSLVLSSGMTFSIGLFFHINGSLLTLAHTHTSGMLVYE